MGFAEGFLAGQRAVKEGVATYREGKIRQGLEAVAKDQGEDITIAPKTEVDDQGVPLQSATAYKFQGQTYAAPLSDTEKDAKRMLAMAQVYSENGDPEKGLALRSSAAQLAREGVRDQRDTDRYNREVEANKREDDYRKGRDDLMANSPMAAQQKEYEAQNAEYQTKLQAYTAAKTAPGMSNNPSDTAELGAAPVAPTKPSSMTPGMMLGHYAALAEHDAKYGKISTEGLFNIGQSLQKAKDEGYMKALNIAQSGGSLDAVISEFNKNGSTKIDPKNVVSDESGSGPDGAPTRIIKYRDDAGNVQTINTLAELNGLGKADAVFSRYYQQKADQRGDASLDLQTKSTNASVALSGAQLGKLNQETADKKELATVRSGLNDALKGGDPVAIKTAREALMSYTLSGKGGMSNMSPEEKKANFYLASGVAKDATEAAVMAHQKVQSSPKDDYMALMKPNSMGMMPKPDEIDPIMAAMHGDDWKDKIGEKKPKAAPAPGKFKAGDTRTIVGGPNAGKTATFDGTGWAVKP